MMEGIYGLSARNWQKTWPMQGEKSEEWKFFVNILAASAIKRSNQEDISQAV